MILVLTIFLARLSVASEIKLQLSYDYTSPTTYISFTVNLQDLRIGSCVRRLRVVATLLGRQQYIVY